MRRYKKLYQAEDEWYSTPAYFFSEGLQVVGTKFTCWGLGRVLRYGYITQGNRLAFEKDFAEAHDFSCGRAKVRDNPGDPPYYINREGNPAFPQKFLECHDFDKYGLAFVRDFSGKGYHIKTDGTPAYCKDFNILLVSGFRMCREMNGDTVAGKVAAEVDILTKDGRRLAVYLGIDGTILRQVKEL